MLRVRKCSLIMGSIWLTERPSPRGRLQVLPVQSTWKWAWAIKQNPSFCLYLNFPLVFFSQTTWCWAEPVSVGSEWHMRIVGSDAVLVLFVLLKTHTQQFFLQHASKNVLQNQEWKASTKIWYSQGSFYSCSLGFYPSQLWSWPVGTWSLLPQGDPWNPWNIQS